LFSLEGFVMAVSDEIITARKCGSVRCGLSSQPSPTVQELAHEFGLRDEAGCYKEIEDSSARRLVRLVLRSELAHHSEIMPESRAAELTDRFFAQFGPGARYFTNGTFHEQPQRISETVTTGASWEPVTEATFDTGVLIIASRYSGCLWVEDED
jgi:hypothetical protein